MIVYLPISKGIRTKIDTNTMQAYKCNMKLPFPFSRAWKRVRMTDQMFEEMRTHVNRKSK